VRYAELLERLADVLPGLDEWCRELAGSAVTESLQHDDLHSDNVCWSGSVTTARFIDWGDATWGSPLSSMLATMNSIAFHAGVFPEGRPIDDPRVLRVRDAYLEPFTRYATRHDLVRHVGLARRIGCVGKALSYQAALGDASLGVHAEYEFPVRGWLLELLEAWAR
jgi:Phosphotransferase enzyme family